MYLKKNVYRYFFLSKSQQYIHKVKRCLQCWGLTAPIFLFCEVHYANGFVPEYYDLKRKIMSLQQG